MSLFIFGGPSGIGKSAVAKRVFTPEQKLTTSTSRIIRDGEVPNVDYYFLSTTQFIEKIENDDFIEHAPFASGYYGLTKEEYESKIDQGDVYIILTESGVQTYKEKFPDCIVIYIDVNKDEVLQNLKDRGESEEIIEKRMRLFDEEARVKAIADYIVINKRGFFEDTVRAVEIIIKNNKTDAAN